MIFNEYYNNSILLCCKKDNEFKEAFEEFVNNLPEEVISRCKKVKRFGKEIDDCDYELELVEEGIEFSVGFGTLLNVSKITPRMMKEVYNTPHIENEMICELFDVVSYSKRNENCNEEVGYEFSLVNIDNKINLKVSKTINDEVTKEEMFELSEEEVKSLVYKNILKR